MTMNLEDFDKRTVWYPASQADIKASVHYSVPH